LHRWGPRLRHLPGGCITPTGTQNGGEENESNRQRLAPHG
jgi:hypothetical protein